MPFIETRYEHVVLDPQRASHINGTSMKIAELVTAQAACGWSPEELHVQFPHLSLGQIHAALAYYWDHREALDAEIARRAEAAEQQQRHASSADLAARLRMRGAR